MQRNRDFVKEVVRVLEPNGHCQGINLYMMCATGMKGKAFRSDRNEQGAEESDGS